MFHVSDDGLRFHKHTRSCLISNDEPRGIQPFSESHVVLSDPTSARGREESGRTERRGGRRKRNSQRCGAKCSQWRKKEKGDSGTKKTNEKNRERIKNKMMRRKSEQRGGRICCKDGLNKRHRLK